MTVSAGYQVSSVTQRLVANRPIGSPQASIEHPVQSIGGDCVIALRPGFVCHGGHSIRAARAAYAKLKTRLRMKIVKTQMTMLLIRTAVWHE